MRGARVSGVSVSEESISCVNVEYAIAHWRSSAAADDFENTCIYTEPVTNKREACDDVVRACAAGGYYSGGMDVGLGVLVDCLEPLRHGKHPARVNIDQVTLHACLGPNLDDAEGDRMATDRAWDLAPPPLRNPRRR